MRDTTYSGDRRNGVLSGGVGRLVDGDTGMLFKIFFCIALFKTTIIVMQCVKYTTFRISGEYLELHFWTCVFFNKIERGVG